MSTLTQKKFALLDKIENEQENILLNYSIATFQEKAFVDRNRSKRKLISLHSGRIDNFIDEISHLRDRKLNSYENDFFF